MGDASQTGNAKNLSLINSRTHASSPDSEEYELDLESEISRTSVFYTHASEAVVPNGMPSVSVTCRSLDELLFFLESDLVDSIWFAESITSQERAYITGWARIFRPGVSAHLFRSEMIAN
ncbi:hypothetical protein EBU99_12745 [bacterium]|nr:hypothetical protein [bacterium]